MKQLLIVIVILGFGINAYCQQDSVRGKKFELTGKLKTFHPAPLCGYIAFATVAEFELISLEGMTYRKKQIGIIITCPEFYNDTFFKKGQTYRVIFSDTNQADFAWVILNKELLQKNGLQFDPYAVSIKKLD